MKLSKKGEEADRYPREMISVVCPCCGEFVPLELILNAGSLSDYLDLVGIREGGYMDKDANKNWPVIAIEVMAEENRLLKDKIDRLLKDFDYDKAKEIMPNL